MRTTTPVEPQPVLVDEVASHQRLDEPPAAVAAGSGLLLANECSLIGSPFHFARTCVLIAGMPPVSSASQSRQAVGLRILPSGRPGGCRSPRPVAAAARAPCPGLAAARSPDLPVPGGH